MCLFGQKTFQELDSLLPSEMTAKAPCLQPTASWKERTLHLLWRAKNRGQNPRWGGHFGCEGVIGDQALPLGSIHRVKAGLMPPHQRERAAGSLELVSAMLWWYHAANGESKPFTAEQTCGSLPGLSSTPRTRATCYKLVIWTWKRTLQTQRCVLRSLYFIFQLAKKNPKINLRCPSPCEIVHLKAGR